MISVSVLYILFQEQEKHKAKGNKKKTKKEILFNVKLNNQQSQAS